MSNQFKIFIVFSLAKYAAVSGVRITAQGKAVIVREAAGCALFTPAGGHTCRAVLKFSPSLGCTIPAGSLPPAIVLDFELLEVPGKGFRAQVLSARACCPGPTAGHLLVPLEAAAAVAPAPAATTVSKPPTSEASQSFLVQKCIAMLAKQQSLCLPLGSLQEMLQKKIPYLEETILIELFQEFAELFGLGQESTGELNATLKPINLGAAWQLLNLCHNVAVFTDCNQLPARGQHHLTAWVSANTIILEGLQGTLYHQQPDSILVFNMDSSLVSLTFAPGLDLSQLVHEGQLVTVTLKTVAVGQSEVLAHPLALEVELANGQCIKVLTSAGNKFTFNKELAIQIFPRAEPLPPKEVNLMVIQNSNIAFI